MFTVQGKAPTRQLHSIPIAVSGSGHTRKQVSLLDAVIHLEESQPQKRFLWDAAHPSCDSPSTARYLALGANNVYLVGENRTWSVRYCSDAMVYGHTTTAMHDKRAFQPPPSLTRPGRRYFLCSRRKDCPPHARGGRIRKHL